MATVVTLEAHYAYLQEEEWELLKSAYQAIKTVVYPMNIIIHFCIILSLAPQNMHSVLQMLQELKPRFDNLSRRQRGLLQKSNNYKNDCTNNFLIYHLDCLAGCLKSSINLKSLVRCF